MDKIKVMINDEVKLERDLEHTNPSQLLTSIEGMIKFSEDNKGSAFKMARDLKSFLKKG